jgi:hypothetical protein
MNGNQRAVPILADLISLIGFEIEVAVKQDDLDLAADLEAERDQTIAALEVLTGRVSRPQGSDVGGKIAMTKRKRKMAIPAVGEVPKDLAASEEAALVRLLHQILREARRKKGKHHR